MRTADRREDVLSFTDDVGIHEASVGEQRREKILAASWRALTEIGFEKITTRRIAEAAGINIATLHYHFGSKEALLIETVRYAQRWASRQMRDGVAGASSPTDMLLRAFAVTWEMVRTRPGVLRFDLAVRGFRDDEARREADSVYSGYRSFVCEIIRAHVDSGGILQRELTSESLADYIVATVDGIVLHHTLFGDDAAAERNFNLVKRHVLELMNIPMDR
jgi:AcrR family transcriptional regulator